MSTWKPKFVAVGVVLLFFPSSYANSNSVSDDIEIEQYEVAAVTTPVGGVCLPKVSVNFVDHGWHVETVEDPDKIIKMRPTYGVVGAFTQYKGINFKVVDSGSGCEKKRTVTVTWNSQTVIYMPIISSLGECRYNLMMHHEMEHLRIFLQVPRDFEGKISQIAAKSSNPQRALRNFQPTITAEIRRRNEQFHSFERQEPRRLCSSTSLWSQRTW